MWPNPQFPVDLVAFTEEIINENFIFFSVWRTFQIAIFAIAIWHKFIINCRQEIQIINTFFVTK